PVPACLRRRNRWHLACESSSTRSVPPMKLPRWLTHTPHDHHDGLAFARDLERMRRQAARRRVLGALAGAVAGATLLPFLGCTSSTGGLTDGGVDGAGSLDLTGADLAGSCAKIPGETAGPYPGDGTNGPNALTLADIVRSDIRSSIGGATGVATG